MRRSSRVAVPHIIGDEFTDGQVGFSPRQIDASEVFAVRVLEALGVRDHIEKKLGHGF